MSDLVSWLLVNPTAGRQKGRQLGDQIKSYLDARDFPVTMHAPEGKDKLINTAREALQQQIDHVILVGGDGTFSLGVNCLMQALCADMEPTTSADFPRLPLTLGFIPAGTGNDFVKAANIPTDWQRACDIILSGKTRAIDLGRVRSRRQATTTPTADSVLPSTDEGWVFFLNHIASGLDAQVGISANHVPLFRGNSVYYVALLYHLIKGYAGHQAALYFPDKDEPYKAPLGLCAIANGIAYGGSFYIAPDAKLDDGQFTVLLAKWHGRLATIHALRALQRGEHLNNPMIQAWETDRLRVTVDPPIPLVADGELVDAACLEYEIELLSQVLTLFATD